jgi:8-oxo-dGTP pyrophosphatase MutT (NUDIX family)
MVIEKIIIIIILAIIVIIMSSKNRFLKKDFWKNWEINKKNFSIHYKGKTIWYSRSVAVVLFAFAKNADGEWCVLANKRGSGTPNFQGYWNAPCGYLDYNERGETAAVREALEETGISISADDITLLSTNTIPDEETQNVTFRYGILLDKKTNDLQFSKLLNEKNEVDDIEWVPFERINNYVWAFNHLNLIIWAFRKLSENK